MKFLPDFLTIHDVLDLHQMQIASYGGADGIRSMPLLESALAMPLATFDPEMKLYDAMINIANKIIGKKEMADIFQMLQTTK